MVGMDAQRDHLRFALAIHEQLGTALENTCFSPYSVAGALSLVAAGARGPTATELRELLTSAPDGLAEHVKLLTDAAHLPLSEGFESPVVEVANTLWAWRQLNVPQPFRDELAAWPSGDVREAPFRTDPDAARKMINDDVAERTHGLIPELVPPDAVAQDTVASLVNALYLRAAWLHPFERHGTQDGEFHGPTGTTRIPMMAQTESMSYTAREGWQAVGLPAAGGVQAVVLLPDGSLAEQEPDVDAVFVEHLLAGMTTTTVDLRMPRMRLDVHCPLKPVLRGLGVETVFSDAADLSGISAEHWLYVDSVQHQAVLRLDEDGLEGAAATAVLMRPVSMVITDLVVRVDRPFLLLVRHAGTGAVYFLARVARP